MLSSDGLELVPTTDVIINLTLPYLCSKWHQQSLRTAQWRKTRCTETLHITLELYLGLSLEKTITN
jgi:hypothetical protein